MLKNNVLEQTALESPLQASSTLSPKGGSRQKTLIATVILTSLVDAFSILVIYLLVSSSNSGEMLYISKDMELPVAAQSEILDRNTLIKIENDKFFIENKEVPKRQLVATLIDIRKELRTQAIEGDKDEAKITVQADRRLKYKVLNSLVLASSQAGFSEIKFAVLVR